MYKRQLLEEKGFRVEIRLADETVFTDRRGLCFLLGQLVSNSVKYALCASHGESRRHKMCIRDSISRELEGMRQMGLLQTGRGKIYVLDRAALESMAN